MRPTITLFKKKKFKNGSHSTIHTFKNNFDTMFSVFSKINCIQMDPYTHKQIGLWPMLIG